MAGYPYIIVFEIGMTAMLSPLLICFGILAILVYKLYGGPQHKNGLQSTLSFLVVAWIFVTLANLDPSSPILGYSKAPSFAYNSAPSTSYESSSSQTYTSNPGPSVLSMPETYPQTHAGCGGGCVSLGDEERPVHTCSYNRHTEFAGSIRQKIERMTVASDSYHHSKDDYSKSLKFSWPVNGLIIQSFGNQSDGINMSVPLGTEIKAMEQGEVAFAGSGLSGYGNMILIRHPNGYVSVYAHNSELIVKRGDKVTRGQTIAKSGQTGNVGSPQLHFELRKGPTPVDPTLYLSGL